MTKEKKQNLIERPPIIVVLGHIDHGKTTLLDSIRKTNVAGGESGGITQHIGAYEITHPSAGSGQAKKMTFIDTPGHEAFSKMRSRGAKVADIAILIVAANEGLKPQTKEAIKHIQESGIDMVVAINKIDLPDASPQKVKQQLAEEGILLEGWGGTVSNQEISAKSGKGIPELLDLIALTAEMKELKADPLLPGEGVIIEAKTDTRIGNIVTLLIKNGTAKTGDFIVAGKAVGKIKKMENDLGKTIKEASFSSPAQIIGFDSLPAVGDEFYITKDKKEAENLANLKKETEALGVKVASKDLTGKKVINVLLKADFAGTKEALEKMIEELVFENVAANITKSDIGEITENDIKFARSTSSIIAGFKVGASGQIKKLAEQNEVKIITAQIIYELIENIKKELASLLTPEIVKNVIGKLQILATFKQDRTKMIVGGKIIDGKAKRRAKIDVMRKGELLMSGSLVQLQHNKEDVAEVATGRECGIAFQPKDSTDKRIEVGDILEIYEEEEKNKTL
ncbi:translation initiation factor IF-2 [Candidatus Azambacteria bacterium]|nr:translation initiation factor IF-2 [Candidatus Azambacteria bacterium]